MPFSRVLSGFMTVAVFLALWREIERRFQHTPDATGPALKAALPAIATEGGLLTLFAALWFGSLGAGGTPLLFLLLGALMEIPARLRSHPVDGLPWRPIAAGVARILLAGVLLGVVLG
jgi:hypothetical protein